MMNKHPLLYKEIHISRCYRHISSFIKPIVKPADKLPLKGIPKLLIANEAAAAL
jgi:hypothetical protein